MGNNSVISILLFFHNEPSYEQQALKSPCTLKSQIDVPQPKLSRFSNGIAGNKNTAISTLILDCGTIVSSIVYTYLTLSQAILHWT